jgi:hypothetical protein
MFSRQPKESKPPSPFSESPVTSDDITTAEEFQEMMAAAALVEDNDQEDTEITSSASLTPSPTSRTTPEIVTIVEKISGILSPYFIVLVGLFLYKNNVFLGTILIIVGILSLLKISWKDITSLWKNLQNTLNSQDKDFLS